ncbi:MAG: ABC transporter permease [Muribaculaceae bacterium]|nr:ABC transporter permease [Muribaculaceae bacterium]MDE5858147.1 ABC transporter permease [Muribaculaceae bacterium]MDE7154890.1 ABC transporter permease [Muribaculaceae bacterium]MDE7368304.1 ABC transporter permease [Muribaculaceae bacterium]
MFDLISEIGQTLSNNKLRTALTGFAVAWGIFMLIVLLGMSRGVVNSFNDSRMSQGTNTISVWGGMTSQPYNGYKDGRYIGLKQDDMSVIKTKNRGDVADVTGSLSSNANISTPHDYITTGYNGVYPSELPSRGDKITEGRNINDADISQSRKVVILTEKNAAILFPGTKPSDVIGQRVLLNGLSFIVIGLINPEFGQSTYIPFTTARMMASGSDYIDEIKVQVGNISTLEEGEQVEQGVRNTLSGIHNFSPDDKKAVWIWNRFTQHMTMDRALSILDIVVWLIGIFTMLSGIIGVSNIMFVSVKERTHEIGIRRAIGAKPRNILVQILTESVAITTLFGYIGVFLGILVTQGLAMAFNGTEFIKDPTVDISIAVKVTCVLIVAGCLAGLFPALKALKVKPVEALRDE